MRVSLPGMLSNAARCIDELTMYIQERNRLLLSKPSDADFENYPEPLQELFGDTMPWANAAMLREAMKHARETREGKYTVAEFAEFYCLTEPSEDKPAIDKVELGM